MKQDGTNNGFGGVMGGIYYSAAELVGELGISRQTLWRWRKEAKIPSGHRFRNGQVLFSEAELEKIRRFACRIEPIGKGGTGSSQSPGEEV